MTVMVKVVYFNQWFSSMANIMEDLRNKHGNSIKIIASSRNKDHAYKDTADVFLVEDWEETEDYEESMRNYLEWVIGTCKKYKVDLFFAKKHVEYIVEHAYELFLYNVHVVAEDSKILHIMNNKAAVYEYLKDTDLEKYIPEYKICKTVDEAIELISEHENKNDLCLKFNTDEGGASFRKIDDSKITFKSLYTIRMNTLSTYEAIKLAVNSKENINKLLFMEVLDGPEISVDCYNSKNGFIAICREKQDGRRERIYYNKKISSICEEICHKFKLMYPFNVQFRYKHGKSKTLSNMRLLEVNTRMSGGLYYETLFGLNLAEVCVLDMFNRNDEYKIDDYVGFSDKFASHVEKAIKLDN